MRDHIRREAAQSVAAAWWLVPVAFAAVGLVAVASIDTDAGSPALSHQVPARAPALLQPAVAPPASGGFIEVTEHVQAF